MKYTASHISNQKRATMALLKFCEDHGYQAKWLTYLQNCLSYLNAGNIKEAYQQFEAIPQGGMGTFNDWYPPVIFPNESEEYVVAVFEALCTHWTITMNLSKSTAKNDDK